MFNLRNQIREVIRLTDLDEPKEIAKEVMDSIPREYLATALDQALPLVVAKVLMDMRHTPSQVEPQETSDAPERRNLPTASHRVANLRSHIHTFLDARYQGGKGWVKVGAMGTAELDYVRDDLCRQADAFNARALVFNALAIALTITA